MRLLAFLCLIMITPHSRAAEYGECVVLLHGLARSSHSMNKLERAFAARGFMVANVDYPSRKHRIEDLATIAVTKGIVACERTGYKTIHFVTHSLGGILVRHYLSHHSLPRLGRVVMLAPPNQGSEVVDRFGRLPGYAFLNGPAGQQLGTNSKSVPLLLGPVTYPVGIIAGTRSVNPVLSLALTRPHDGKVTVARTKVPGMADFIELPASHPFIMRNRSAIAQTLAFIETGAFLRPSP